MLSSTSEVYGDPLIHPRHQEYWENVNPIGTRGVYNVAKRYAETLTMAYHRYHLMDTRIVRIFNTNGPGMRPDDGRITRTSYPRRWQRLPSLSTAMAADMQCSVCRRPDRGHYPPNA